MNKPPFLTPSWSTSSADHTADTSPMELAALGEHLDLCRNASGRMFGLRCFADSMNGFVAARFVTTLTLAALVLGIGLLAL